MYKVTIIFRHLFGEDITVIMADTLKQAEEFNSMRDSRTNVIIEEVENEK